MGRNRYDLLRNREKVRRQIAASDDRDVYTFPKNVPVLSYDQDKDVLLHPFFHT